MRAFPGLPSAKAQRATDLYQGSTSFFVTCVRVRIFFSTDATSLGFSYEKTQLDGFNLQRAGREWDKAAEMIWGS